MNDTNIGWTDKTWNPVTGCKHGCEYCYAKDLAETRLSHIYPNGFKPTFWEDRLEEPIKLLTSKKIFTTSMGDLFGHWVPNKWINKVLEVVNKCSQHEFQFLTKNPARYLNFDFPENVWVGTSADNCTDAHCRSEVLNMVDAKIKFLSLEPLLDNVASYIDLSDIDWVIIAAQTNPDNQPKKIWVERIIKRCKKRHIPIFMKDNLDWGRDKLRQFPKIRSG